MNEVTCPECGAVFAPKATVKPRSYPQLKRYFAVIKAAFHHWPESHQFRPKNADHLRYWLEVEAGHFEAAKSIRCESVEPQILTALLTAVMRTSDDDRQFVDVDGQLITVKRALSISYPMLAHLATCKLFEDVDNVIKQELGIEPDELLRQTEAAA